MDKKYEAGFWTKKLIKVKMAQQRKRIQMQINKIEEGESLKKPIRNEDVGKSVQELPLIRIVA